MSLNLKINGYDDFLFYLLNIYPLKIEFSFLNINFFKQKLLNKIFFKH